MSTKENLESVIISACSDAVSEGEITEEQAGEVNSLAREGEYNEASDLLEEYKQQEEETPLDDVFLEEEKQVLAEALEESVLDLLEAVEEMREDLKPLMEGSSRGDLKQYLRGKKSSRTKKKVESFFDAYDSLQTGSNGSEKLGRALSGFSPNLTMTEAQQFVEELEEKVGEAE